MKRLLGAALLCAALLGGTGGSARAGSFGIGLGLDFSLFGSCAPAGAAPGACGGGGCGGGSCCRTCLPPQGWSPYYPPPMMYGGLLATTPQGGYPAPCPGYGYAPPPANYGYALPYVWLKAPVPVPATPGISTVPPPEPPALPLPNASK